VSPRRFAFGLLLLLVGACKRAPATGEAAKDAPAVATALVDAAPPAAPATALDFTPEASASPEERKRALAALLAGASPARELAEQATDPGASFDNGLRQRLTSVEVNDTSAGLGSLSAVRGDVRIGASTQTVKIDGADRVLAGLRPRLRQCYQVGLGADPTMTGKLTLTAKVLASGDVGGADVVSNTGLAPSVAACAQRALTRATFDAPGESGSTLTVSVTFVPAS
jgi:hypothetical protein